MKKNISENAESVRLNQTKINKQLNTKTLAKMAMLVAIAVCLALLVHFPIFPMVSFLEYDPADIPILIGAMAFGPLWGTVLTVITAFIQGLTVSASSGIYGIIMHIIATLTLSLTASLIYFHKKTKKSAIIGLSLGAAAMTVVMFFANMVITPLFMGLPLSGVMSVMVYIVLFNLIKAVVNSAITFFLYKRISPFLHK